MIHDFRFDRQCAWYNIYNYIYCYTYNCIYTYIETQIYKIKEGKHAIPHMMIMTKGSYAAARRDN